jgi:predicted DNA-binding transcriptional regulator AlpA
LNDTHYLTAKHLAARFSVCRRTISRWAANRLLNFPQPVKINRRRYWRDADIEQWEREQQRTGA